MNDLRELRRENRSLRDRFARLSGTERAPERDSLRQTRGLGAELGCSGGSLSPRCVVAPRLDILRRGGGAGRTAAKPEGRGFARRSRVVGRSGTFGEEAGRARESRHSSAVFPLSRHGPARSSTTAENADRAVLYDFIRFSAGILTAYSPLLQGPGEPAPVLSPLDLVEAGLGIGEHPHPVPAPLAGAVAAPVPLRACHHSIPLVMDRTICASETSRSGVARARFSPAVSHQRLGP